MAINNKFKVFADDSNANVQTDTQYASETVRQSGAIANTTIASKITNTALKTASLIAVSLIDALGQQNPNSTLELGLNDSQSALAAKLKTLLFDDIIAKVNDIHLYRHIITFQRTSSDGKAIVEFESNDNDNASSLSSIIQLLRTKFAASVVDNSIKVDAYGSIVGIGSNVIQYVTNLSVGTSTIYIEGMSYIASTSSYTYQRVEVVSSWLVTHSVEQIL